MTISIDLSAAKRTRWYELLIRFVGGGLVTALIGIIAKKFGPSSGGLFLAFPSIFAAAVILVESHEEKKKESAGLSGAKRGRQAAGLDAYGASIGSIGLFVFGIIAWRLLPEKNPWSILALATAAWFGVSGSLWWVQKRV